MPTTLPPARYDAPWKAALTHACPSFMAFYFPDLYPLIDWSQRPRFRDKELAQIGFGDAPDGMVADMLVEVRLRVVSLERHDARSASSEASIRIAAGRRQKEKGSRSCLSDAAGKRD